MFSGYDSEVVWPNGYDLLISSGFLAVKMTKKCNSLQIEGLNCGYGFRRGSDFKVSLPSITIGHLWKKKGFSRSAAACRPSLFSLPAHTPHRTDRGRGETRALPSSFMASDFGV
jgi:hypothetical protein